MTDMSAKHRTMYHVELDAKIESSMLTFNSIIKKSFLRSAVSVTHAYGRLMTTVHRLAYTISRFKKGTSPGSGSR